MFLMLGPCQIAGHMYGLVGEGNVAQIPICRSHMPVDVRLRNLDVKLEAAATIPALTKVEFGGHRAIHSRFRVIIPADGTLQPDQVADGPLSLSVHPLILVKTWTPSTYMLRHMPGSIGRK